MNRVHILQKGLLCQYNLNRNKGMCNLVYVQLRGHNLLKYFLEKMSCFYGSNEICIEFRSSPIVKVL